MPALSYRHIPRVTSVAAMYRDLLVHDPSHELFSYDAQLIRTFNQAEWKYRFMCDNIYGASFLK